MDKLVIQCWNLNRPKARKKTLVPDGQMIFENWSCGPVDVFFNHNLNFPNLINVNMQTWSRCRSGNLEASGAGCQVLGRLAVLTKGI